MTEPFRWKNCFADIVSVSYGEMARAYVREVVEPSMVAMDAQIGKLRKLSEQDDPFAIFSIGPTQALAHATLIGFCLSLQSVWEKQLREYLQGCARELVSDSGMPERVQRANWKELNSIFQELRGVPLSAFDEFDDLDLLQLLGNACRHGDGPSLRRLATEHSELWSASPQPENAMGAPDLSLQDQCSADNLPITRALLERLANAIASFWLETEYIYKESIHRKDKNLEAALVEERKRRAGGGRPWDPKDSTSIVTRDK